MQVNCKFENPVNTDKSALIYFVCEAYVCLRGVWRKPYEFESRPRHFLL